MRPTMTLRTLTIAVLVLAVSACQTNHYNVGTGPLTLSTHVSAGFQRYLNRGNARPAIFVVSTDGRTWSSSHCAHDTCIHTYGDELVARCNARVSERGQACHVFAVGRDVVWQGAVTDQIAGMTGYPLFITMTNPDPSERGSQTWTGTANLQAGQSLVPLRMSYRGADCRGTADQRSGGWHLECGGTETFKGSFVKGWRTPFEGFGKMSNGETVDFSIHEPLAKMAKVEQDLPPPTAKIEAEPKVEQPSPPRPDAPAKTEPEIERRPVLMPTTADQSVASSSPVDPLFICLLPNGAYDLLDRETCYASDGVERSQPIKERPAPVTKAEK